MAMIWKLMVGLYLYSDDSLGKTQRICWMSVLWFFCFYIWYHRVPIKSPSDTRESSSNSRGRAILMAPQPLFAASSLLTPSHHHALYPMSFTLFCPLAQAISLFGMGGVLSPIHPPLFTSNVTSSTDFFASAPAAHCLRSPAKLVAPCLLRH